jgi:hypothetical protein
LKATTGVEALQLERSDRLYVDEVIDRRELALRPVERTSHRVSAEGHEFRKAFAALSLHTTARDYASFVVDRLLRLRGAGGEGAFPHHHPRFTIDERALGVGSTL